MGFKNKPQYQSLGWCCDFLLATICAVVFAINVYFNGSLACPHMVHHYANNTPNQVMHKHMTQITLGSCLYWIWGVTYAILILWFLYVFYLLLCRQSCSRNNKTPLFSGLFWFLFIIVNLLCSVWLYLFVHNNILISGIVLLTLTVISYVLNILAYHSCSYEENENEEEESNGENMGLLRCEITLLKLLTLNGLPLYSMVCTITSCLQWIIILQYNLFNFSDNLSSVISLAVLTLLLMLYWGFDLLFERKNFAWTWLPSFALIFAFGAMIAKKHSIGGKHLPGLFFVFILLIVSVIELFLKSCALCLCHGKSRTPRFSRV